MEIPDRRISYKSGDVFRLKPISDWHIGADACDEKAIREYMADSDERTYFIGIGDLMDSIIVTDAKRYRKSSDNTKGNGIIDEQVDRCAEILMPYRERILGIGTGNHEDTIVTKCGTDPTARLCARLDVLNLGYSGLFEIIFTQNGSRGRSVVIRYHHGYAGGRTEGGQLTTLARETKHWEADVFLYGHGHNYQTYTIPRMGKSGSKLISKDQVILLCGTFLKTYVIGDVTYSEKKGYAPVRVGSPYVTIKPLSERGVLIKAHSN